MAVQQHNGCCGELTSDRDLLMGLSSRFGSSLSRYWNKLVELDTIHLIDVFAELLQSLDVH